MNAQMSSGNHAQPASDLLRAERGTKKLVWLTLEEMCAEFLNRRISPASERRLTTL